MDQETSGTMRCCLPRLVRGSVVELGLPQGWDRYVGARGDLLVVERFGASGPAAVVLREYGFTVDNVCVRAIRLEMPWK